MTGAKRIPPGFRASEDAQSSETTGVPLAWQRELDAAIADIDSRLSHPRRRTTDAQPSLPTLGQPEVTSEMIDEIAWRVSERLRHDGARPAEGPELAAAISETVAAPAERDRMPSGIAITIRLRRPFFRLPWPFQRRRRHRSMITFSDYRIT